MKPPEDTAPLAHDRDLSQTEWTDEELAWSHTMARLILDPALPDDEDDRAPLPVPLSDPTALPEPTANAVGMLTVEAITKTVVDAHINPQTNPQTNPDSKLPPEAPAEHPPEEEQP